MCARRAHQAWGSSSPEKQKDSYIPFYLSIYPSIYLYLSLSIYVNTWINRGWGRARRAHQALRFSNPTKEKGSYIYVCIYLSIHLYVYLSIYICIQMNRGRARARRAHPTWELAYTRYCFTRFCVCKNRSSLHYPRPLALPILLQ